MVLLLTQLLLAAIRHPRSGNSAFVSDLARWTFGSTGRRRVVSVQHGLSGRHLSNPHTYRVKDELVSRVRFKLSFLSQRTDLM
jgi:hypothetical protein